MTNIGNNAFSYCKSLTKINIPNSVTSIGNYAFYGCKSLVKINIPNGVASIGYSAFGYIVRYSVFRHTARYYSTFGYCCSLTIPSSVVDITGNPFCGWYGELHNKSKNFIYENHVLFSKDRTTIIAYIAKETNYIIPDSVTTIGDGAFRGCKTLISIDIPKSVTNIGRDAFRECDSLHSINIPDSVTTIGNFAFL